MQNKKNQTSNVGQMIQRCHKWRQKRKQYIDLARQTTDEVERVRAIVVSEMQNAVHLSIPLIAECGVGNNWLEAH